MHYGCAVSISESKLLIIRDSKVREFDTSVAGPLSAEGWRPAGTWPDLATARFSSGCVAIEGLVVVVGGWADGALKTTEIINIATKTVSFGPELKQARAFFHLAVLPVPGGQRDRVLALGGYYYDGFHNHLDSVEEWLPGTSTWQAVTGLQEARNDYGVALISEALVCT
jgi:hypothetical protein